MPSPARLPRPSWKRPPGRKWIRSDASLRSAAGPWRCAVRRGKSGLTRQLGGGRGTVSDDDAKPCCAAATSADPDFKLSLSTNVSNADFQLGYCMTGTLERGCRADGRMEMTHYAMIKRKGY